MKEDPGGESGESHDAIQAAEETGHKPRKRDVQTDLAGGEAIENEEDAPERWTLHGPESELFGEVKRILKAIKEFDFVTMQDLQCVTTNKDKKSTKTKKDWHVFAEIMKPKPILQAIAELQGAKLGPFVILFRPLHFKREKNQQELTIIHELYHLRFNETSGKVSLRSHWGFGDTDIEQLRRKYLQ